MKKNEKIMLSVMSVLFIGTLLWMIFMQDAVREDYYRWAFNSALITTQQVIVNPLMYLTGGFLGTYFIARKAFRDDLALPYKLLLWFGIALVILYIAMLLLSWGFKIPLAQYIFVQFIHSYKWTMIITGIIIALAAEHHYRK